jgi:hypothetical protein
MERLSLSSDRPTRLSSDRLNRSVSSWECRQEVSWLVEKKLRLGTSVKRTFTLDMATCEIRNKTYPEGVVTKTFPLAGIMSVSLKENRGKIARLDFSIKEQRPYELEVDCAEDAADFVERVSATIKQMRKEKASVEMSAAERAANYARERTTGLVYACFRGDMESVARWIAEGASVTTADNAGLTPLMAASKGGQKEVVEFLLTRQAVRDEIHAINRRGQSALDIAVENAHEEVASSLRFAAAH